jgi:hypothetical protein
MQLVGKKYLEKFRKKNAGNTLLAKALDKLVKDLEDNVITTETELLQLRPDADSVHPDGFYFLNIALCRTLILIEFDDSGEITIVWCGSHDDYELTFKNNKNTIRKWLKAREWIN